MEKVDVAGLKIDNITKAELLGTIKYRFAAGQKTWITTPYSEFLYRGLRDNSLFELLNKADFAVPDGIGIFWAKRYVDLPLTVRNYWLKILQAFWQAKYTLAAILFNPRWIYSSLSSFAKASEDAGYKNNYRSAKIPGSDLIWDLADLAAENNFSIYLLGGFGNTPKLVAEKLSSSLSSDRKKERNLKIAGWSNKSPDDSTVLQDIKNAKPDMLFVAYGPILQEKWISDNLPELPVKLAIGLGGTFDYIAGVKTPPPKFIRSIGLEWLYRLITQPHRIKRIWQATIGLTNLLVHYKVFNSGGLRPNSVMVILNNENKIFVGKKLGTRIDIIKNDDTLKWKNYWQLPQGGIEDNEDIIQASMREAEEETGMKNLEYLAISKRKNTYIWNNSLRRFWHNRNHNFKGQTQHILYFKFNGAFNALQLPEKEEFCDYKWVIVEELAAVVAEERQALVKIIQQDFAEGLIKLA